MCVCACRSERTELESTKRDSKVHVQREGKDNETAKDKDFFTSLYSNDPALCLGSIDLGARCLMLEDPDHIHTPGGVKKRRQSSPCFNLILMKDASKLKSGRDAFASRFQLQAISTEEKQSWLEAFQQCGISVLKQEKKV